ncbi:uncharacterized protein LTR77_007321 [Saxophila tyrrhenica]|uniref:Uncharacterized protein n=1 Tax=Saxophila tyrrhenica TaxID=1690608 RepID=A0AAV9P4V5_9PEZI|nr:hypothetical protein LTR77_007321 [Saxophila tyrrhenica]
MAAAIGKYAANKMLKKEMDKYKSKKPEGGEDPYFAYVEDPRRPGKPKKIKKQIPAYIPQHDAEVLASVRRKSYRLDMCLFNFLGIRFGWEAVIGIIPAFGDAVGVLLALMVFRKCCSIEGGLDQSIKMRMMLNIIVDFVVGLVPFIGDLADAAFKCNTKNLRLLEEVLDKKYKPHTRDERDMVGVNKEERRKKRASGIFTPNDPPPATAFEEYSDDEYAPVSRNGTRVQQPQRAYSGARRDERPRHDRPVDSRAPMRQESGRAPMRQETGRVRA